MVFCENVKEDTAPNDPEPLSKPIRISVFNIYFDYARNLATPTDLTLIFLHQAPIVWYSKKQNTVESSTFISEFVAMRTTVEMTKALGIKLCAFIIDVEQASDVFCDNQSVVANSSVPTVTKKHNVVAFYLVWESCAAG